MFRDCTENYYLNIKYRAPDAHANQSIIIKWQNKSTTRHQIERHTTPPRTSNKYATPASLKVITDCANSGRNQTIQLGMQIQTHGSNPCDGNAALVSAGFATTMAKKSLILPKIFHGRIEVMTTTQQNSNYGERYEQKAQ